MDTNNAFVDYYRGLSREERESYAKSAGTTTNYIEMHLVCSPPRKVPRPKLMEKLAEASGGKVSHDDVLGHFYRPRNHSQAAPQPQA